MGLYEDVAGANTTGRGRKIKEPVLGEALDYAVSINHVAVRPSQRHNGGDNFIIEFEITRGSEIRGNEQVPIGTEFSCVYKPARKSDPGHIRRFVGALLGDGSDEPEISKADYDKVLENGFTGTEIMLLVEHIETQNINPATGRGWDFYIHSFSPLANAPAASTSPAAGPPGGAPPPVPVVPVETWVVHPDNPAYEYVPGTSKIRARA